MLEIVNIHKYFPDADNHKVLEDINISIADGEFVCILGPSGCGKTVFLYMLAGFLHPSSGQIILDGNSVKEPSAERILIFQDYGLFPWRTVYKNIIFGLEKSKMPIEQKKDLAEKYLNLVGLQKFRDWYPHKLSGGMRQRVAIARALISDPKVLLMDEPFSALDSQNRKLMRRSLEEIWQKTKKTIIFVTHSVNEAIYLADTIYLFSSLPAKIKKVHKIDLPRPRNQRDQKFLKIAENIEKEMSEEFQKSLEENPAMEEMIEKFIQCN